MDGFTSPTGTGIQSVSAGAEVSNGVTGEISLKDQYNDTKAAGVGLGAATSKQHEDTEAMGTASLGRAAVPPPSERSSTLDAKDSKRPLLDEEACGFDISPGQSESATASSALLVTGAIQSRRRLVPVSIVHPPSPPILTKKSLDHVSPLSSPGHNQSPPIPPRPWATTKPASDQDIPPLSPLRDPAPPVPPRTYLKTTPISDHEEAPPLPQRLYLPENEVANGFQMSIEELDYAGVLHGCRPKISLPLEEEGEERDTVACSTTPLSTVLLPRKFKRSDAVPPCNFYLKYIETNCSECEKFKKVAGLLFNNTICYCCKKKMKVVRRSST